MWAPSPATSNRIVTNEHYQHLHESAKRIVRKIGGKTPSLLPAAPKKLPRACSGLPSSLRSSVWNTSAPSRPQSSAARETFKFLKAADHPVLLHVLTQKGRGYQPALDGQKKFHGLDPTILRPVSPSLPDSRPSLKYSATTLLTGRKGWSAS